MNIAILFLHCQNHDSCNHGENCIYGHAYEPLKYPVCNIKKLGNEACRTIGIDCESFSNNGKFKIEEPRKSI